MSPVRSAEWLVDGPDDASRTLVLAHGAGQGMDAPFMQTMAGHLAAGGLRVVRFEFPYMAERRRGGGRRPPDRQAVLLESWHGVLDGLEARGLPPSSLVLAGKSLGGRMASLIADHREPRALACLGYPFHPPGRPERLRIEHLRDIATPTLICQGTRDPFGSREEVAGYELSAAVRLAWIPDGEHSFRPRRSSGRSEAQNLSHAAGAVLTFLSELD